MSARHYQVTCPHPHNHLFHVTFTLEGWAGAWLDLKMPVWTPGSYLVREYARHVEELCPQDAAGRLLPWRKITKNHWQVSTEELGPDGVVVVRYTVSAHDLTVRTNHLDHSHGYFNGAALFLYTPTWQGLPLTLEVIVPYPNWQVTTALPPVAGHPNTFRAPDYHALIDSPCELGTHTLEEFTVQNRPHRLAIWGTGNLHVPTIVTDIQKLIHVQAELFGSLPYSSYLFIVHLCAQGRGGLEHRDCCTLQYPRLGFGDPESYQGFMQLVAHEFFHVWNVKRIRPRVFDHPDYDRENYTTCLWFSEGVTSYYDLVMPWRAGIYGPQEFLRKLAQDVSRYLTTPGRLVQSLASSSFDAWIKLYRPDPHSSNSQVSYYLKGEIVAWLLDLHLRAYSENSRSLDDVLRDLWQEFGQPDVGFTEPQLLDRIGAIAQRDLGEFWEQYLYGTAELSFNAYLEPFGLELVATSSSVPFTGLGVKSQQGREVIQSVQRHSPGEAAGLVPGDEILAIAGVRLAPGRFAPRLMDFCPGEVVEVTIFRQDLLQTHRVSLAPPQPSVYSIRARQGFTPSQAATCQAWLGIGPGELQCA